SDLNAPFRVRLAPGGDLVHGQVTLDNCGEPFATESDRVVRRQYIVLDAHGHDGAVSNELVAYDSDAHAAAALREWKQASQRCPSGLRHFPVAGTPAFYETILREKDNVSTLPNRNNAITVAKLTVPGERIVYALAAIQV